MSLVGRTLGTYHILEELGRSNISSVYRGHNPQLDRYVAIKLLDSYLTPETEHLQRLLEELQPLTRLYHPNIVTLHAIGQEGTQCFLARDYVEGNALSERLQKEGPLTPDKALEIARQVASALDYAHDRGLVHGDLRPTDILLDRSARVGLTNLGLVPALERAQPKSRPLLRGTAHYVAPERSHQEAATPASDLYSLGAVICEMLTGQPPRPAPAAGERASLCAAEAQIPDVVALVLRWAMAPRPEQRPHSAGDLVSALRDAASGQVSAAVLREIAAATAPSEEPTPEEPAAGTAQTEEEYWSALEQQAQEHEEAGRWAEAAAAWRRLYALSWRCVYEQVRDLLGPGRPANTPGEPSPLRSREEEKWRMATLDVRPTGELRHPLPNLGGDMPGLLALAFSPGGDRLASAAEGGTLWLWDVEREKVLRSWQGHEDNVWSLAISPDGRLLASASEDGRIGLWDPRSGELVRQLGPLEGPVNALAFAPNGAFLASGGNDGMVYLWDVQAGEQALVTVPGHSETVFGVAISPDGRLLASASEDGSAALWDIGTGELVRRWNADHGALNAVAFAPDGSALAAGGEDGLVYLWDIATQRELYRLAGHEDQVTDLAFSPDGSLLASASSDHGVRLWSAWYGWDVAQLERHSDWVTAVKFSPDGSLLATAAYDGLVWLWVLVEGGRG